MKKSVKKYFSFKGNTFLFTDNKWKDFSISKRKTPGQEYVLENDQDIINKTKLRYEFGEKASKVILNELKTINSRYFELTSKALPEKTGYGHEFEILAISVLHDISIDDVINEFIVRGTEDGQIDAVFYNAKKAIVYQIKTGFIDDNAIQSMKNTIVEYNKNGLTLRKDCSNIREFLDRMNPSISKIPNVEFKTISINGKLDGNVDYSFIYKEYLKNLVIKKSNSNMLILEKQVGAERFDFCENKVDQRTFFMFARANTLVEDIKKCYGDNYSLLFCENVRGDLGKNQSMIDTLTDSPKLFCSYNNGISITGKYDKPEQGGLALSVQIVNPNIINGQQTILNLIKAYEDGIDLSEVTVPVFIKNIETPVEELNIAKYNNTQKSISPIDLLSLDLNLRNIQISLIEQGYYLNLISSGKNIYIKNAKSIFGNDRIIKLSDFVKLYSVSINSNDLGKWKNNFNAQVESKYKNGFPDCDISKAKKICEVILKSKSIIKENKSDFAIADLAIQYLLFKDLDPEKVKAIIDYVNDKYSSSVKKKADIYKKPSAINSIRDGVNHLKTKNQ